MKRFLIGAAIGAALAAIAAIGMVGAQVTSSFYYYRDGQGYVQKIFAWAQPGPVFVPASVPTSSAGVEEGIQSNPTRIDPVGTTPQPVFSTVAAPVRTDPINITPQQTYPAQFFNALPPNQWTLGKWSADCRCFHN